MSDNRSVFISYRRHITPSYARAIYQALQQRGYQVTLEPPDTPSDEVTMRQIGTCGAVVVLLSQGALEKWPELDTPVQDEINAAITLERRMISVLLGEFAWMVYTDTTSNLMNFLPENPHVRMNATRFQAGIDQLHAELMRLPANPSVYPLPPNMQAEGQRRRLLSEQTLPVTARDLQAEDTFEQAFNGHLLGGTDPQALEKAMRHYTDALSLQPKYAAAHLFRGIAKLVYHSLKSEPLAPAMDDFEGAVRLDPDYAEAHFYLGEARQAAGDLHTALKDYSEAIRLVPTYALAYMRRAAANEGLERIEAAIADLDRVIELDPTMTDAHVARQRLSPKRQQQTYETYTPAHTPTELDEYIAENPNDADAYFGRGMVRQTHGDFAGAIADYSAVIRLRPKHVGAHMNRAFTLAGNGDINAAIKDYEALLGIIPLGDDRHLLVNQLLRELREQRL